MAERTRIGLDDPAFSGRLRQTVPSYTRRAPIRTVRSSQPSNSLPKSLDGVVVAKSVKSPASPAIRQRRVAAPIEVELTSKVISDVAVPVKAVAQAEPAKTSESKQSLQYAAAHTHKQHIEHHAKAAIAVAEQAAKASEKTSKIVVQKPQPFAHPARPKLQKSRVLHRAATQSPLSQSGKLKFKRTRSQTALLAMAVFVFAIGIFTSVQTLLTNHNATAQVSALSKKVDKQTASGTASTTAAVPSTTKPSGSSVASYAVGPTMPRYLNIPELGVHARVLQLGILANGALGTPSNIYDTGWYSQSSLPGEPGAMLIDGHVSSWTSHGVFYGIKLLKPGDTMQVVRGDGTTFNYKVVKSQTFTDNNVDMTSALTPVTPGVPGLNLITCTGQVKPGTSEFNQRVIVYTQQI